MFVNLRKVNSGLDRLVRPELRFLQRSWSAFQVCAGTGLALALLLGLTLGLRLGLSLWIVAVLALSCLSTHFVLAAVTRIIKGRDRLTYYHHMVAVMLVAAGVLWLIRAPMLPYLDVTVLGLGVVLACGRLGCLMVSCCHGRPYRWGVCYREEHTAKGIAPYFAGVRLFPIQGVESLLVFSIVFFGTALLLNPHRPGDAVSWFVISYAAGRFGAEFLRGDAARPYFASFSEAQWTSLILMGVILAGELSGILNFHVWHALATTCVIFAMIAVALRRRARPTAEHLLVHPRHVDEVAHAIEWLASPNVANASSPEHSHDPTPLKIGTTSLGIQISASTIRQGGRSIYHYALSSRTGTISEETVRAVARLILQLKHRSEATDLIKGNQGVFHLLIYPWKDGRCHT